MIFKRTQLSELQQDLLRAMLNQGPLRRARGGYAAAPGGKPFTVRSVQMLERSGLVFLTPDRTQVGITTDGSRLMLQGEVELQERLAG